MQVPYTPDYSEEAKRFLHKIETRRRRAATLCKRLSQPYRQRIEHRLTYWTKHDAVAYPYVEGHGQMPDFENPKGFNEKVRAQFLRPMSPLMTICSDKIAIHAFLKHAGLQAPAPKILATARDTQEFEREVAPQLQDGKAYIKANNASGFNLHWKNSNRRQAYYKQFDYWLSQDFWRRLSEYQYQGIRPQLLAEAYIQPKRQMTEYKVHCFQGEPEFISAITQSDPEDEKSRKRNTYYPDWTEAPFATPLFEHLPAPLPRPADLDLILEDSRRLSKWFLYARIDFMHFDDELRFSELTVANAGARYPLLPLRFNKVYGDKMNMERLPELVKAGEQTVAEMGAT